MIIRTLRYARPDGALLDFGGEREGEPLTGGVSSDIWLVRLTERSVCVKRALAQLRVKADWRAPVERSGYEAAWMRIAGRIVPGAVPELLYEDRAAGAVVMAYLEPGAHRLWKEALRQGEAEPQVAAAVGNRLGRIHAARGDRTRAIECFRKSLEEQPGYHVAQHMLERLVAGANGHVRIEGRGTRDE